MTRHVPGPRTHTHKPGPPMKLQLFGSKDECRAAAGPKRRIFRYQRGAPRFYHRHTAGCTADKEEPEVPKHIAEFSHCLMDSSKDGIVVFDVDAVARRTAGEVQKQESLQTGVRFAVFVFVKVLVEYVVRNSSPGLPRAPAPKFWMSDASGARGDGDAYKFSYHIVVRFPREVAADGSAKLWAFKRSASRDLCALLNKCMAAPRIMFRLAGVPDAETSELRAVMEAMRATLRAELSDKDLKGGIFDGQIYKSNSLRILGAQRPTGGNELMHVDTETGRVEDSIWRMDRQHREFLQRMHDPYPSEEEHSSAATLVRCTTVAPRVIDSDDDDNDDEASATASQLTSKGVSAFSAPKKAISVHRTNVPLLGKLAEDGAAGGGAHEELAKLCTYLFGLCCAQIPGARVPPGYEFKFRQLKLCRPRRNGEPDRSMMIALGDDQSGGPASFSSSLFSQEHYYSVQAQSPFCPWKSARCCKGASAASGTAAGDACHNQNRVIMEVHPKGEFQDARLRLICFSAKCVAGMPAERNMRVAIAQFPAMQATERERPSMRFIDAVRRFAKLAGGQRVR